MKRRAFTLIELLTVIGIIALLVSIMAPSLITAVALARATLCRNNLSRLGEAFALSRDKRLQGAKSAPIGGDGSLYPMPMMWPGTPMDVVPDEEIYKCPDDEVVEAIGDMTDLEYVNPYGAFVMDTIGNGNCYKSRRGSNAQGTYTEFLMQDDIGTGGQYAAMSFNGWVDTDGGCRVYDTGHIYVFHDLRDDTLGCTPDWSGARGVGWPNRMNTCGNQNDVHYRGAGAFSGNPRMQSNRGQTHELPGWEGGATNYGINSYAHNYSGGGNAIVLVDYKQPVVNVDSAVLAEETLINSARHLGKVNMLWVGGSVTTASPMAISPRLQRQAWTP